MWGGHTRRTRRARAYNGGFGAESPAGLPSMGRSPGQGVGENLVGKFQDGHFELNVRKRRVSQAPNHDQPQPLLPSKNSPDLHQSQE